jgi:flagellar biosynthesis protein FlhG
VIAITSGKGGVGKTNLTVNLGIHFARQGRKVLIIDGDVGLANVDILLDETPAYTLQDVLNGEREVMDVLVHSVLGVSVLPGTSGISELARLSQDERRRLLDAMGELDEYDTVLIDTPAGIGSNALFFAGAAQEIFVVATPEPTALADAYAMIKVLHHRQGIDRIGLVLNQTRDDEAFGIFERLSTLTARFLSVVLELVGSVPQDPHVPESVKMQQPILIAFPAAPASQGVRILADNILMRSPPPNPSGRLQFFWRRLLDESSSPGGAQMSGQV